jgi:hypothetical protein
MGRSQSPQGRRESRPTMSGARAQVVGDLASPTSTTPGPLADGGMWAGRDHEIASRGRSSAAPIIRSIADLDMGESPVRRASSR